MNKQLLKLNIQNYNENNTKTIKNKILKRNKQRSFSEKEIENENKILLKTKKIKKIFKNKNSMNSIYNYKKSKNSVNFDLESSSSNNPIQEGKNLKIL